MLKKSKISTGKIIIPTYPEPPAEEMPMFAENRVHQRTSGRPYPNKVVLEVNRNERIDKEYTVVTLENKYVKIEILPEIGGRIYSAFDKLTGYDYFYKQHVIKPALIGALGSWISGGVEFNWPFHHRASGFMPCDYKTEELSDGTVICHLSEHDPIDRMKGMVSVILRPDSSYFETRMRLYNRTPNRHSFLWWENAAVPVHEKYQIFFPQDVTYVNFHYLKSRTTYPIAGNGVFNGIPMDTDRDISWHKNTKQATSYFASASDYDFFGGYDHAKQCGVVHIGDHHISPGKKMFTWAYCQLAKSWENALTDTDGQYAELMAGSYSDNQPNFSWLEPYETKCFSQFWYPISKIGSPTFANLNCAFQIDRENNLFKFQSTKSYDNVNIRIFNGESEYLNVNCKLEPTAYIEYELKNIPQYVTVSVTGNGKTIAEYTEQNFDKYKMPPVIDDMPSAAGMNSAQELYLAGVHVEQYRDPAIMPDAYWKEALKRDINHIPSLIAMARYEYNRYDLDAAEDYILKAIKNLQIYNERTQSGEAYYVYAQILEAKGDYKRAYDYYYKSSWAADCVGRAMTRIAMLDVRNGDYENAVKHSENALDYGRNNNLAVAVNIIANRKLGNTDRAEGHINSQLKADPLDHTVRYLSGSKEFYLCLDSDPVQTCLDIAFDFSSMGLYEDIIDLLENLPNNSKNIISSYVLGYYKYLCGLDGSKEYVSAQSADLGKTYPFRYEEIAVLSDVIKRTDSKKAKMLLGCLYYNKLHYEKAAELWNECDDYISKRNLAVAYFSHLDRKDEALPIMEDLLRIRPDDEELLYETVVLMDKMGVEPKRKIDLILAHNVSRDDVLTELAKAYNQAFMPDKAIKTLMSHEFIPCEGGEHAIADQYMFAYLIKGRTVYDSGDYTAALEYFRCGQVLPQSLGAGIWNHCKLIPLKYHEALCLEKLGEKEKADEIFRYISGVTVEYFSNMHLKELPFWQAKSFEHLGEPLKAQHLITKYYPKWKSIKDTKDKGNFCTTPFFISFIDDSKKLRLSQCLYLTALCDEVMGNTEKSVQEMKASLSLNNDNMYTNYFSEFSLLP